MNTFVHHLQIARVAATLSSAALGCGLMMTVLSMNACSGARRQTWKSETTGNEYRVWIENDVFHAEWANVPGEMARHNAYLHTACRRAGARWVGMSESLLPCTVGEGADARIVNWCKVETQTEIDSVASGRITGRGQTVKKADCQRCKVLETGWAPFVWVPKR
jgi:hypothetical protein